MTSRTSHQRWYSKNRELILEQARERYAQKQREFVGPRKPRPKWCQTNPATKIKVVYTPTASNLDEVQKHLMTFLLQPCIK